MLETGGEKQRTEMGGEGSQKSPRPIQGSSTDDDNDDDDYDVLLLWRCDPTQVMASSLLRFLDHTQRCTKVGRTPLDE